MAPGGVPPEMIVGAAGGGVHADPDVDGPGAAEGAEGGAAADR
ncbi:MAG: hypothetical protein OXG09_00020 [Chloroflexi bacterium]|nr:hypothetical protein [Chloroflexota bacterium]